MALSLAGEYHQATGVFEKVLSKGINVNIHMMNALLHMHSRRGEHDSFLEVMNKIAKMAEEPTRESYRILMRHWYVRSPEVPVFPNQLLSHKRNPIAPAGATVRHSKSCRCLLTVHAPFRERCD